MRPDVRQVEDVDALLRPSLLGLLLRHDLHLQRPRRVLALLDRLVQVLLSIVVRPDVSYCSTLPSAHTHSAAASSLVKFLMPWSEIMWNWAYTHSPSLFTILSVWP